MKFELWKSTADRTWRWHLKAGNREIIAHGEGYSRKIDCLKAIDRVRHSVIADIVILKTNKGRDKHVKR